MTENEIGKLLVDSALAVHRELGPGLLETVYEVILANELQQRGLGVERSTSLRGNQCRMGEALVDGLGHIW